MLCRDVPVLWCFVDVFLLLLSCHSHAVAKHYEVNAKMIIRKIIIVIDTAGVYDMDMPEKEVRKENVSGLERCCAPWPHASLMVLRIGRFTEQKSVVKYIRSWLGDTVLNHTVHGNDLEYGMTIRDYIQGNTDLKELVDVCRDQVHIIDNKCWTSTPDAIAAALLQRIWQSEREQEWQ